VETAWAAAVQQQCLGELEAGVKRYERMMEEGRPAALKQQAVPQPPPPPLQLPQSTGGGKTNTQEAVIGTGSGPTQVLEGEALLLMHERTRAEVVQSVLRRVRELLPTSVGKTAGSTSADHEFDGHAAALETRLSDRYHTLRVRNAEMSSVWCESLLGQLYFAEGGIAEKLRDGYYTNSSSKGNNAAESASPYKQGKGEAAVSSPSALLLRHWSELTRRYNQQGTGPRKLQALQGFRDRYYAVGMTQVASNLYR
jgi:hypothetical protein